MPPANSPVQAISLSTHLAAQAPQEPTRVPSPNTFVPALRHLSSPVLDLAATLTLEAENDVDDENISFLRRPVEEQLSGDALNQDLRNERRRRPTLETQRQHAQAELRNTPDEDARARRMHARRMEQLRSQLWNTDSPRSALDPLRPQSHAPYGGQAPSQQSLYDWAPAQEDNDEADLDAILAELRFQQPNTHPDILRVLGRAQLDAERDARTRSNAATRDQQGDTLRSAAILQFRRNQRITARSRDLMQRHIMEREQRANNDADHRSGVITNTSPSGMRITIHPGRNDRSELDPARDQTVRQTLRPPIINAAQRRRDAQPEPSSPSPRGSAEAFENMRRRYLEDPNNQPSRFETMIKLLHLYRAPDEDHAFRLEQIMRHRKDTLPSTLKHEDIARVPASHSFRPSSWLSSGTIFIGTQSATSMPSSSAIMYRLANNPTLTTANVEPPSRTSQMSFDPSRPWLSQHLSAAPSNFSASPGPSSPSASSNDKWTVKVAVHAVDYESMTLQGTMEAFDVPSMTTASRSPHLSPPSPPTQTSSEKTTFSTFLEGEIIDFATHTLQTDSYRASTSTDAAHWRKLEPFVALTDEQLVHALLNPDWLREELLDKYVLMRWKERCFVGGTLSTCSRMGATRPPNLTPAASSMPSPTSEAGLHRVNGNGDRGYLTGADGNGYGLSISGFYYTSMRRSDGHCQGLYFDPQSSPYQHLELRPTEPLWGCGAWEFR